MSDGYKKIEKKFRFPTAFTILFVIMLLAIALTWIIPAGSYSKLSYSDNGLHITNPQGDVTTVAANQSELEKLNINISIDQFLNGNIRKSIAIPGTYQQLKQSPKGLDDIAESMVQGTIEGADIIVFILVLGGLIGIINKTGAFDAGLVALSEKTKNNKFLFVALVSLVMAIGGTTCGIEEEAIAFYPILVPIFLTLGYDSIVCGRYLFISFHRYSIFND